MSAAEAAPPAAALTGAAAEAEAQTDRLIARIEALAPLIRQRAGEAESLGRLTDDVMQALEHSEVFKALTPRKWGGFGLGLRALCEVGRVAARADTSTAWVTCFLMEHCWMACRLEPAAQARLFAGGPGYIRAAAPLAPGGSARRAPGGFRVSGKWRYASGVAHAEWSFVSCMLEEGSEAVPFMFLLPVAETTVHDEWQVAGMCATSSTNLSAQDLFVPQEMAMELERFYSADRHPGVDHAEPFYRYPLLPPLLVMLAAIAVGSAEGALELGRARLWETAPWGVRRIDRAGSRVRWAAAGQDVRCARLLYQDMLARTVSRGDARQEWSLEEQGQHDLDVATTTHLCKKAIAALLDGCGSSAFQRSDPLQRYLRDISVVASHLANDWDVVSERASRWLLGLGRSPTDPMVPRRESAPAS